MADGKYQEIVIASQEGNRLNAGEMALIEGARDMDGAPIEKDTLDGLWVGLWLWLGRGR